MAQTIDLGGNDIICNDLKVGATGPGQAGTSLSASEITVLDGVTPGTAAASKAVVLGSSKEIATITTGTITNLTTTTLTPTTIAGAVNFTGTPTFAAGLTYTGGITNLDSEAISCTGTGGTSTATLTKQAGVVTTASITTAGGATHVITITKTGVAAGDLVWITKAGGTNTGTENYSYKAVTSTDTITVTLSNHTAATALNGTCIFNILVCKA